MNNQDNRNLLHPSMLQIQYLLELEKTGKKRGSVAMIADTCGVSHGPVSRFFKECIGKGYLTEKYEFTTEGAHALLTYKRLLRDVKTYLKAMNIPEKEIPEKMKQLIENVDYDLLRTMVRNARQTTERTVEGKNEQEQKNPQGEKDSNAYFIEKIMEKGKFQVGIAIHQISRNSETRLSMAHQGFEHLACIRNNTRGSWLELSIQKMNAISRVDHAEMEGKLSSLKYECNGSLHKAEIRGNKVNIPLEACRFIQNSRGIIKGRVAITVTCSVGCVHMPESTALLIFWL